MATPPAATAQLAFVGDISAVVGPDPATVDQSLAAILSGADLVIGNCESPIVERPVARIGTKLGIRHAMRREYLEGLMAAAGLSGSRMVLSIANNHMLDQGITGFVETIETLASLDIAVVGGAEPTSLLEFAGLKLEMTAFTVWRNAPAADFAGRVTMVDELRHGRAFRSHDADLVIALPHWDWEFHHFPHPETRSLACMLADRGATLIVGGHSHVLQPAETVGGAFVAYSLGDFVGTAWSRQPWPGRIGAILLVDISVDPATRGQIVRYEFVPYMRLRERRRERLIPLDGLDGPLRAKVTDRLASVFAGERTRQPQA